ncbi:sigma factor-like helix-turn-helix DNA-binding protein [Streptomyces sp. NPDC047017]|uniref:sigma factor-like helix-turn-helix DNA-binding protein n=1 Tax=Streptomyces sp. NPDC047017 TaxID=3155024 RepID=UPI0033FC1FB0
MRERQGRRGARRAREFEAFVAGAGGRLLHTATLLTAEAPDANPRARRLLTLSLAHTYACWDGLRGEDPYERARQLLAGRFAREAWHRHGVRAGARHRLPGVLAGLAPQARLVVVLRLYEGVAEEQTAALLGLPPERVRVLCDRALGLLAHPPAPSARSAPPSAPAVAGAEAGAGPKAGAGAKAGAGSGAGA